MSRIKPTDIVSFQDGKKLSEFWINLDAAKAVKAKTKVETEDNLESVTIMKHVTLVTLVTLRLNSHPDVKVQPSSYRLLHCDHRVTLIVGLVYRVISATRAQPRWRCTLPGIGIPGVSNRTRSYRTGRGKHPVCHVSTTSMRREWQRSFWVYLGQGRRESEPEILYIYVWTFAEGPGFETCVSHDPQSDGCVVLVFVCPQNLKSSFSKRPPKNTTRHALWETNFLQPHQR